MSTREGDDGGLAEGLDPRRTAQKLDALIGTFDAQVGRRSTRQSTGGLRRHLGQLLGARRPLRPQQYDGAFMGEPFTESASGYDNVRRKRLRVDGYGRHGHDRMTRRPTSRASCSGSARVWDRWRPGHRRIKTIITDNDHRS
jgi:hypothetical protein